MHTVDKERKKKQKQSYLINGQRKYLNCTKKCRGNSQMKNWTCIHTNTPTRISLQTRTSFWLWLSNRGLIHQKPISKAEQTVALTTHPPTPPPDTDYLTMDCANTIQMWTCFKHILCYLWSSGITGNQERPQLEVCPWFDCVYPGQSQCLQVFTDVHTPPLLSTNSIVDA